MLAQVNDIFSVCLNRNLIVNLLNRFLKYSNEKKWAALL